MQRLCAAWPKLACLPHSHIHIHVNNRAGWNGVAKILHTVAHCDMADEFVETCVPPAVPAAAPVPAVNWHSAPVVSRGKWN